MRQFSLYTLLPLGVLATSAAFVAWRTNSSFWFLFLVLTAAIVANGLLATLEDDLPGGFNNPDGSSTPKYATVVTQLTRWVFAAICLALAVAAGFAALRRPELNHRMNGAGFAALCISGALMLLRFKRSAAFVCLSAIAAFVTAAALR